MRVRVACSGLAAEESPALAPPAPCIGHAAAPKVRILADFLLLELAPVPVLVMSPTRSAACHDTTQVSLPSRWMLVIDQRPHP